MLQQYLCRLLLGKENNMSWKSFFTSSIGRKFIMALTGFFLICFLLVHVTINGMIFLNDNGETFNFYAHILSHNYFMRIAEIGLFIGFIIHIVQGLMLWSKNAKARKKGYAVKAGNKTSKWYSRSMGLLGSLILLFLVVHLSHFWAGTKSAMYLHGDAEHNLYYEMQNAFSIEWVVIVYVLGCIALAWHLLHGFKSAFQTFGINSSKYNKLIQTTGIVFSILVPFVFALMPVAVYFGWVY